MTTEKTLESKMKLINIGSRDSELALKQTHNVLDELQKLHPEFKYEIITMKTIGDKILDVSLAKVGSKSLFTKELEVALDNGDIDIIVHSLKDLPTTLPDGMAIGSILEREDPRDCVIMHPDNTELTLRTLPLGSVVGTSSVRRVAQLSKNHPHLKYENIRGNLNTRLRKLDNDKKYSAIILAVAGVKRMGWESRISEYLESDSCMYAVGQGALAVECRQSDGFILEILEKLNHKDTVIAAAAERAFMRTLEGGCSAPVAVNSEISEDGIKLTGGVWSLDGSNEISSSLSVTWPIEKSTKKRKLECYCAIVPPQLYEHCVNAAYHLGLDLANLLLSKGAKAILDQAKLENSTVVNAPPPTKVNTNGTETNGTKIVK